MAYEQEKALLAAALASSRIRPRPEAEVTLEEEAQRFRQAVSMAWNAAVRFFGYVYYGVADNHFEADAFGVAEPQGVWRECPVTGEQWFEPDGAQADYCPSCGARLRWDQ